MSGTRLGVYGLATATAIAALATIHTVDMSGTRLGAHGPATATALAASPTIHTVNMNSNNLGAHGPATATALAASPTIRTVHIRHHDWGAHGPATAAVFADHNQYVADLVELARHICIEVHPICDKLINFICSYLDDPSPIDYTI
jgi:hypothetical protein